MSTQNTSIVCRALSFFIFLLFTQSAVAGPVDELTARKAATQLISSFTSLRSGSELKLAYTGEQHPQALLRGENTSALYYIYTIGETEGFVIISGDDKAYPVLGYTDQGTFQAEQMPENLSSWLDFYKQELLFAIEQPEEASADITNQWVELLSGEKQEISPAVLLRTANWDQSTPYNDLCPLDDTGKRSVSGCVATAMGIVMKYHNWPERGEGRHSYKLRSSSTTLSASFNVAYDWNNMLDAYTKSGTVQDWNTEQAKAVSTLVYHCGVSVEMDYKSSSSGAYTHDVITSLEKYFGYDKGMSLITRDIYTAEEWAKQIIAELDNDRPVLYGGATVDNSGHLFIVDGYATTGDYFHVNWGWSGTSNGYYRLSSLQPSWQGIGGSTTGAGYSYSQDALIGIQPALESSFVNNELYFLVYDPKELELDIEFETFGIYTNVKQIVQNEPFKLCYSFIYDYGRRDFNGDLALFLEDKEHRRKETLCVIDIEKGIQANYIHWESDGIPLLIESEVEEGDRIRMYYRPNGYDWRLLQGEPGVITELPVYKEAVTNTSPVVKEEKIRTEIKEGQLYIYFSPETEVRQVSAYTLQGQKVKAQSFNKTAVSPVVMDLNGLGSSVLIVTVQTPEGLISRKVILRK